MYLCVFKLCMYDMRLHISLFEDCNEHLSLYELQYMENMLDCFILT